MTLSEAIRLGSMMKPQTFGIFYDGIGTCANGAARDACGALESFASLETYFPIAASIAKQCPICGERSDSCADNLGGLIAHINDDHRWTRERIADWVETVEASAATTTEEHTGEDSACVATAVTVGNAT
jgi:hypothetical protein